MGRRTSSVAVLAGLCALAVSTPARAIPAFARKYGVACSACHDVWPKLNDFGQNFRDNGYRMNREKDNPVTRSGDYWPIAVRATVGYQNFTQTLVPTDTGPTTTTTGTFGFTGLDLLTAGALGEQFSVLVVYVPGLVGSGFLTGPSPTDGDLESAFVGFHRLFGTPWANLRVGKHAPDLPVDEHRILTLSQGYNVYHFVLPGSAVTFAPGENQVGLEAYGHSEYSRLRYSVSLLTENGAFDSGGLSNNILSTPVVWGHVQGVQYLNNDVLAAARVGAFGAVGWHPTAFSTLTDDTGTPQPVPNTGHAEKTYERYGAELKLDFLSTVNPLQIAGVLFGGVDDKALITDGDQDAKFLGGFVELNWTLNPYWILIGRYERIRTTQQGVSTLPQAEGDLTAYTAAVRFVAELSSRAGVALQAEVSHSTSLTYGLPNATGAQTPAGTTALLVVDFAY